MLSRKLRLGYSALTGNVYLGKDKKDGRLADPDKFLLNPKRDITSDFMNVLLLKFEPNTSHIVSIDGEPKYRLLLIDVGRAVSVDGKDVTDEE